MDKDRHEEILGQLLNGELDHSTRTELLQELRADYSNVHTDFEQFSQTTDKLQKDNSDLILSNSKLFRQLGITNQPDKQEEEKEKEFSETITLEALEKQL